MKKPKEERPVLEPAGHYTLRNGSTVVLEKIVKAQGGSDYSWWVGRYEHGGHYSVQLDGFYSPVLNGRPHQLDIIWRA